MEQMDRIYKVVQQSSKGIRAIEISKRLNIHKTTVHRHLFSLELMGRVESKSGIWLAKTGEQTIKPLEKEIVIELPIPKDQWLQVATLEALAKEAERACLPLTAEDVRIVLDKLKETRTITIRGKNVDDLDLVKAQNLILLASQKSSKSNLKGLLRQLRISRANESLRSPTDDANKRQKSSAT